MADKLADQISYLLAGAGWHVEAQIKAQAGSTQGPAEQWRVLALLTEKSGRTISDLAQSAFIELPTLSKMIDRMVSDALVYRVPDSGDRRRILMFLSERGRTRFSELQSAVQAYEDQIRRRLGARRAASLKRLLADLSGDLTRREPAPGRLDELAAPPPS